MTNMNSRARAFAVDGTGRIIRAGNQVRIRTKLTDVADHGRVVEFQDPDVAMLDIGQDEPVAYLVNRLARNDGPGDEPVWVFGSL